MPLADTRGARCESEGFNRMTTRRAVIRLLGGAAAWPVTVKAQQPRMPMVGYLSSLGRGERTNLADAFRRGLAEGGYVDERNVRIEYRFAENQYDRLPALAADLVGGNVDVIAATGGSNSISAARAATATIPIVFTMAVIQLRAATLQA
jgi:putative tryptophan/tyrosine transport system substrate-binding protein